MASCRTARVRSSQIFDCDGLILAPAFIDAQLNGGFGGFLYPTEDMQAGLKRWPGTPAWCYRLLPNSNHVVAGSLPQHSAASAAVAVPGGGARATNVGLHLEGPFISQIKYGAHSKDLVRAPTRGMQSVLDCYGSLDGVRLVTIAPELEGAMDAIAGLRVRNVVASAGHSMVSFEQAETAVRAGVTAVTHLFNAMASFHHRDPGLVGLLGSDRCKTLLVIADGVCASGQHQDRLQLAPGGRGAGHRCHQRHGLAPGRYSSGPCRSTSHECAKIVGTDTLAGSIATLNRCVQNFRQFTGCTLVEASSRQPTPGADAWAGASARHTRYRRGG